MSVFVASFSTRVCESMNYEDDVEIVGNFMFQYESCYAIYKFLVDVEKLSTPDVSCLMDDFEDEKLETFKELINEFRVCQDGDRSLVLLNELVTEFITDPYSDVWIQLRKPELNKL
jgi:hypothetical protein